MTKVRDLLTDRWLELRAQVEAAEQVQREVTSAAANEVSDRKDEVAQRLPSDLGGVQVQREVDELAQVKTALHRVEDGIYGDCTDCGEPISPQRRLVQPAAQRCARCQSGYEHALERPGSRRTPLWNQPHDRLPHRLLWHWPLALRSRQSAAMRRQRTRQQPERSTRLRPIARRSIS